MPGLTIAGIGSGLANAALGRLAVESVHRDRAGMGSGANNTARYLGAACGIPLFSVLMTHSGDDLPSGWNVATAVAAALTLAGAALTWRISRRV